MSDGEELLKRITTIGGKRMTRDWPDAERNPDGTLFWYERHCRCDNGDMKPHQMYCDWYELQQARLGAFSAGLMLEFMRLAAMSPEQYWAECEAGNSRMIERRIP